MPHKLDNWNLNSAPEPMVERRGPASASPLKSQGCKQQSWDWKPLPLSSPSSLLSFSLSLPFCVCLISPCCIAKIAAQSMTSAQQTLNSVSFLLSFPLSFHPGCSRCTFLLSDVLPGHGQVDHYTGFTPVTSNTQEAEAGGSQWVWGQPSLHSEFQSSLGCTATK